MIATTTKLDRETDYLIEHGLAYRVVENGKVVVRLTPNGERAAKRLRALASKGAK